MKSKSNGPTQFYVRMTGKDNQNKLANEGKLMFNLHETAQAEADRLAEAYPGSEFIVLAMTYRVSFVAKYEKQAEPFALK